MAKAKNKRQKNDILRVEETYQRLTKGTRKRKKPFPLLSLLIVLLVVGVLAGGYYIITTAPYQGAPKGLLVGGVDIGNMTLETAISQVQQAVDHQLHGKDMVLQIGQAQFTLTHQDMKVTFHAKAAVKAAFKSQQSSGAFNIAPYISIDEVYFTGQLDAIAQALNTPLTQTEFQLVGKKPSSMTDIETQKLVITIGTPGRQIDLTTLKHQILDAYASFQFLLEPKHTVVSPEALDLEEIQSQYSTPGKDAVMDEATLTITPEVMGYGFTRDALETVLNSATPGTQAELPLRWLHPAVTEESLLSAIYPDVLGSYTAVGEELDADRNMNLAQACQSINGIVLMPGQSFSYNEALGERTVANGYRPGKSFYDGKTVYTIGGGICQVSSALYYCALYADLEILERDFHGFMVPYMPHGLDAVVSWNTLDFQFRNNTQHPIRIYAFANGNTTTVKLLGTDTKDYYIKMESDILETIPFQTIFKNYPENNSEGYTNGQIISAPCTGYKVNTYRCKYSKATNELLSRKFEAFSDYKKMDAVVCLIDDYKNITEDGQ